MTDKTPGEMIKSRLQLYKMSQAKLSVATGISETDLSLMINGKLRVTARTAVRMNGALNLCPLQLMAAQAKIDIEREMNKYQEETA